MTDSSIKTTYLVIFVTPQWDGETANNSFSYILQVSFLITAFTIIIIIIIVYVIIITTLQ